jgi:hypothetical protein
MHNAWLNGTYDVPRVAPPGHSQHERGRAIDFGGDLQLAQQLGRQYGLVFPMDDEPWHGQLGGASSNAPNFGSATQYNLHQTSDAPTASPEDVLANRMQAIMSTLGGDEFSSGAMQMVGAADRATEQQMMDTNQFMQPQVSGTSPQDAQVTFAPAGDRNALKQYAQSLMSQYGFNPEDFQALDQLWQRESGWNPLAQNPTSTAFGIAQFLNGTWKGTGIQKTTNPYQQIQAGLQYIKGRYGSPSNALAFHDQHNWY